jgi:hypothetical protein
VWGARRQLNLVYGGGAVVLAGYAGVLFHSWWAFAAVLPAVLWVHVRHRSIRLAGRRRRRW